MKVASVITRLTPIFMRGLICDLVICKQRIEYVWFKYNLEVLRTPSYTTEVRAHGFQIINSTDHVLKRLPQALSHQDQMNMECGHT